jgi:hypothetical protein
MYEFFANLNVISQAGQKYAGYLNTQGNTTFRRKLLSTSVMHLNDIKLI